MFQQPKGVLCPRGCGNEMMFFQEKAAGACRFCQGSNPPPPIMGGASNILSTLPQPMPYSQQAPQNNGVSKVEVVKQNTPEEMFALTGDPRWQQVAAQQRAMASHPAMAAPMPSMPISVPTALQDAVSIIATIVDAVQRLHVAVLALANPHAQAPATVLDKVPPPIASVAQVVPPPNAAPAKKLECMACVIESVGAVADPKLVQHSCEKGATNGTTTQPASQPQSHA